LEAASLGFEPPAICAVLTDDKVLASVGDGGADLRPNGTDTMSFPLHAAGAPAGCLVVRATRLDGNAAAEHAGPFLRRAEFLAQSLQAIIDAEAARRAVATETLNVYRELALLHSATITLNRSLDQISVANALLSEIQKGIEEAELGAVFSMSVASEQLSLIASSDPDDAAMFASIIESRLVQDIVTSGKGEVVNDLAAEVRWNNEVAELAAALIVPLMSHDQCCGAFVLATRNPDTDFTAGDLKQAMALVSVAAAALHNSRLFEEVVEVKNYNESVLENLSNGVITLDLSLHVAKTNAAALRILRREGASLVGLPFSDVFSDDNGWLIDCVNQVMDGEAGGHWIDKELRLHGTDQVSINLTAVPLTSVEGSSIGCMLVIEDITREKRVRGTMARFMSETVVDQLMSEGDSLLAGAAQDATILFSDIRGFTHLSEQLSARQMVGTLNNYFTEMVDVIFENGGTLDKFIGDAIMAVFGAPFVTPEDPDNATKAAIEMLECLRTFNSARKGEAQPLLKIGIGISSGTVVAGTIGSIKRMDYTVIGDHVNLAARIESANKYYGTNILVSEHTVERLNGNYRMREVDRVRVIGRDAPVALYEILDHHDEQSFPNVGVVLDAFAQGLKHYRQREWQAGAECFAGALQANPIDRPTQIFLGRCWRYMARPPDDTWSDINDLGAPA
jgi:adenylate cyclase